VPSTVGQPVLPAARRHSSTPITAKNSPMQAATAASATMKRPTQRVARRCPALIP